LKTHLAVEKTSISFLNGMAAYFIKKHCNSVEKQLGLIVISPSFRKKGGKSKTSEGVPFFSKNFYWNGTFHLSFNGTSFHANGKHPGYI